MQTILLIEDQLEIASMLRLLISRSGHRALLAGTLLEAENIWRAYRDEITLVLTDNCLPDGSGVQFATQLLREKPELKLIIASGLPQPSLPAGAYRLDKPYNMAAFLNMLSIVLPSSRGEDA